MPSLVIYHKGKPRPFRGAQAAEPVLAYMFKLSGSPVSRLGDVTSVTNFIHPATNTKTIRGIQVVGFFSSPEDMEEDEMADFMEASSTLHYREDISFGCVTSLETIAWLVVF